MINATPGEDVRQMVEDAGIPINFEAGSPFASSQKVVFPGSFGGKLGTPIFEESQPDRTVVKSVESRVRELFENQVKYSMRGLARAPGNPYLLNNMGTSYLNSGNFEKAVEFFKKALQAKKDFFQAQANLAKVYISQGKTDEALNILNSMFRREPNNVIVMMNLARLYFGRGDFSRVKSLLDKVITISENVYAYNNRGCISVIQGRFGDAIADFRRALKLNNHLASVHNNLGACYAILRRMDRAVKSFKTALAINRFFSDAVKNLASAYIKEHNSTDAIEILTRYIKESRTDDIEAHELLAQAYFESKEYKLSLSELYVSLQLAESRNLSTKKAVIYNNLGVVHSRLEKWQPAEDSFKTSLELDTTNPIPFRNLAFLQLDLRRMADAKKTIDRYLELFPNDSFAFSLLGRHFYEIGNLDEAITCLRKSLEVNPKDAMPYAILGAILTEHRHEYREAEQILKKGLEYSPKDMALINNLAYNYLMAGDIHNARRTLALVDGREDNVFINATRGLLRLKEGQLDEGRRLYNKAARLAEYNRELKNRIEQKKYVELARYHLQQGNFVEAVRLVKRALSFKTVEQVYVLEARNLLNRIQQTNSGP